jgi:hypothetical protein
MKESKPARTYCTRRPRPRPMNFVSQGKKTFGSKAISILADTTRSYPRGWHRTTMYSFIYYLDV